MGDPLIHRDCMFECASERDGVDQGEPCITTYQSIIKDENSINIIMKQQNSNTTAWHTITSTTTITTTATITTTNNKINDDK